MSKLSSSKFWLCYTMQCGCVNCCFVVKAPANAIVQHKQRQLGPRKKCFNMFYKIDCCAAIHGRIWMNNVPNESRIVMLSCNEISFVIYISSILRNFGVKPGFFFLYITLYDGNHTQLNLHAHAYGTIGVHLGFIRVFHNLKPHVHHILSI